MTYTYDATKINDGGLNQMRFFLGDVFTAEPEKDSFVSDEEIIAVLEGSESFKHAALRLVETLLHRFMYEVDTEVREAKWALSQRIKFWQDLHKKLKDELETGDTAAAFGFAASSSRPPIFTVGLHDWGR